MSFPASNAGKLPYDLHSIGATEKPEPKYEFHYMYIELIVYCLKQSKSVRLS
jgi:hypothetical protein